MSTTGRSSQRFRYDIDGVVRVASAVALPELQIFRTDGLPSPDLVIAVAPVGGLAPRRRTSLSRVGDSLIYREHLGSLGSNFQVEMGTPIVVTAGPLLARSPHVLYTNIVEALLRFLFVKKGRMLLHAACISLEGRGVLLSAKTDTGKTSTLLQLLSDHGGTFLSDDMTIIDADATAYRYPKPLTISKHTLSAVPQNRLRLGQRAALSVQSRVHSRTGRSIGKRLGQTNLPIMSINSLVQAVIPPPKYMITDLVDCQIGTKLRMSRFYIIERGGPRAVTRLSHEDAIEQLINNTEDAYGFPPYAQLAPQLIVGGEGYESLRATERAILSAALRDIPVTRMRVDDFSWPALIMQDLQSTPAGLQTIEARTGPVARPAVSGLPEEMGATP